MIKKEFIKMCMNDFLKINGWESEDFKNKNWGYFSIDEILNIFNYIYEEAKERTLKDLNKLILEQLENKKEGLK